MNKMCHISDTLHEAGLKQYLTGSVSLTDKLIWNIYLNQKHKHGYHMYQVLKVAAGTHYNVG